MTLTAPDTTLWRTRPGWGIAVDLTPPEIADARQLRRLSRVLAAALALVLAAGVVVVILALRQHAAASAEHETVQARTARLQAKAARYADVTLLRSTVAQIRSQLPLVMERDVDLVRLMGKVDASLPAGMSITNQSVVLTPTEAGAAAGLPPDPAVTGAPGTIGTVTLTGTGRELEDLALFVDELSTVRGVAGVLPASNTRTRRGVQYTVTFDLTEELLGRRPDAGGAS